MEKHDIHELCIEYVKNMSEKELKAYHIAKDHLGDSFQLEKSIGFLEWLKRQVPVLDPIVTPILGLTSV
jgi:hypothetical protein